MLLNEHCLLAFFPATFNVQDMRVEIMSSNLVNVTCVFAENSSADGCVVHFNSSFHLKLYKPIIENTTTVTLNNISEGVYNISVFDVVDRLSSDIEALSIPQFSISFHDLTDPERNSSLSLGIYRHIA